MNELNFKPNYRAKLPRTDFNMSQTFGFSAAPGMLLPVYQDFLNAGESEYFSGNLFARTQPLVTAAMCDVDVYLDWFFVPLQMLYLNAGSLRWQTNDFLSSAAMAQSVSGYFPLVSLEDVFDEFMDGDANYYSDAPDYELFGSAVANSFRLLNHLGLNPYAAFRGVVSDPADMQHDMHSPNIFPMFALAYQAIYQDYYRVPLDDRIKRNIKSFNLDYMAVQESGASVLNIDSFGIFELRFRPLHMDYFTSVKVSPILAAMNLSDGLPSTAALSAIDNYLYTTNDNTPNIMTRVNPNQVKGVEQNITNGTSPYTTNTLNPANIRSMFALEKLLRITGRARKDYDSQVLAHLGFDVPHDVKHELTHLGTDKAILHIGEVTSMADTFDGTDGSALGSISGKGYVNISGKKRKFTAPVDGVIMAVYSCVPRFRYNGCFDKQNSVTKWLDLYVPEFDRLGMQPLYVYEAECGVAGSSSNRSGWQYRYEQWKRKYDRVTEAFAAPVRPNSVNQYSAWMLSRLPFASSSAITESSLTPQNFL